MNGYTNDSVSNNYEFSMNEAVACKGTFYSLHNSIFFVVT